LKVVNLIEAVESNAARRTAQSSRPVDRRAEQHVVVLAAPLQQLRQLGTALLQRLGEMRELPLVKRRAALAVTSPA
jgi:hypothetical protein